MPEVIAPVLVGIGIALALIFASRLLDRYRR